MLLAFSDSTRHVIAWLIPRITSSRCHSSKDGWEEASLGLGGVETSCISYGKLGGASWGQKGPGVARGLGKGCRLEDAAERDMGYGRSVGE